MSVKIQEVHKGSKIMKIDLEEVLVLRTFKSCSILKALNIT